jgi:hypothetical protein
MRPAPPAGRARCAVAAVFAIGPRSATTLAQVRIAYAELTCRDTDTTGVDDQWTDISAVTLGPPPSVRSAPDDATERDIAKIFRRSLVRPPGGTTPTSDRPRLDQSAR